MIKINLHSQLFYNFSTAFLQLFYSFSTAFPQLFYSFSTAFLQLFYSCSTAFLELFYSFSTAFLQENGERPRVGVGGWVGGGKFSSLSMLAIREFSTFFHGQSLLMMEVALQGVNPRAVLPTQ